MPITDFQRDAARIISRMGGVYISDDGGTTWADVGSVKGVELNWEPITSEQDTSGRSVMLAADVTLIFVMQQTSEQELAALDVLAGQSSGSGLTIKFAEGFPAVDDVATAEGFTFHGCLPTIQGAFRFDASESTMTVQVTGRVPVPKLIALGSTKTLYFGTAEAPSGS